MNPPSNLGQGMKSDQAFWNQQTWDFVIFIRHLILVVLFDWTIPTVDWKMACKIVLIYMM